jgi:type-1 restriction enzyme ecoprrI specificity protein
MSRLADLINELCPDGVEYKNIGSFADCVAGATPKTTDPTFWDGDIPWMSSGEVNKGTVYSTDRFITKAGYDSCSTKMVPPGAVVIALAGQGKTRGTVARTRIELCTNQSLCSILPQECVNSDFLYHFLAGEYDNLRAVSSGDGTRGGLNLKMIRAYKVPVPPLAVQCEIVKILDQFTTLEAELEAELEARRTQYEYYRNQLLSYDALASRGQVEWVKLKDIVSMRAGSSITSKDIATVADYSHVYPCYGANGIRGYVSAVTNRDNASIIGRQGALSGNISFAEAPFFATEHAVVVTPKVKLVSRWLYHTLIVAELSKYVTKSAQPGLSVRRLEQVEVLFPSIEEQQRIADILDRFDALVNDISSGLPAEIAARRAQYEYYRDRLLSFSEKK